MNKKIQKNLAVLLCIAMSPIIFCACNDDNENVAMENLPYGSTMRELKDTKIPICFDGRYFTDDEMKTVSDYFYSIQTQDADLFSKTQNSDYITFIEKNSGQKYEDFLKELAESDSASLGQNFEYSYIEAVNCGDKGDDMGIGEIIDLMNDIYEEAGKEKSFEDSLTDEKFVALNITAQSEGQVYTLSDKIVYIFTCENGIYIFD